MNYKLFAVDMDGTLLNDSQLISEGNLIAIRNAVNSGIKFVICSGRIPAALKLYTALLPDKQPMICSNGSIILDHNKEIIYSRYIDSHDLLKISDILRDCNDTFFQFFDEDAICSERFEYSLKDYYEFNSTIPKEARLEIRIVPDAKEYFKQKNVHITKVEVVHEDHVYLSEIKSRLESIPNLEMVKSGISSIEIMRSGINKGNALEILAKHYGCSLEECAAVGNDENDISMLSKAGFAIAVGNAKEALKNIADYVTVSGNNNDALAEALNRIGFR